MKIRWLMAVILLLPQVVLAGPNAGGTLVVHDANLLLVETNGSVPLCEQGVVPDSCAAIDTELDGSDAENPKIWKVYAAFPDTSSPRLMGVSWGIHYDADSLAINASGKCGDFELNDGTWPASDTGSQVTWSMVQTGPFVPLYWFAGYQYTSTPTTFEVRGHPSQGGSFGDDTVPATLDEIAGFGRLGFGMEGFLPCPIASNQGSGGEPGGPDAPGGEPEGGEYQPPEYAGPVGKIWAEGHEILLTREQLLSDTEYERLWTIHEGVHSYSDSIFLCGYFLYTLHLRRGWSSDPFFNTNEATRQGMLYMEEAGRAVRDIHDANEQARRWVEEIKRLDREHGIVRGFDERGTIVFFFVGERPDTLLWQFYGNSQDIPRWETAYFPPTPEALIRDKRELRDLLLRGGWKAFNSEKYSLWMPASSTAAFESAILQLRDGLPIDEVLSSIVRGTPLWPIGPSERTFLQDVARLVREEGGK